jgi:6,7-dimethyl-8-ribityllumazine synthase
MSRVFVAVARFYKDLAHTLEQGACARLNKEGIAYDIADVPGAFELPGAIRLAIASGKYNGYIALGCVIRGETTHYDYVCTESARGLNELALQHLAPIGYGVLTVETEEQAWERAALDRGNKGADAAEACLAMMEIRKNLNV